MGVGAAALAWGSAVAPLLLAVLLAGSEERGACRRPRTPRVTSRSPRCRGSRSPVCRPPLPAPGVGRRRAGAVPAARRTRRPPRPGRRRPGAARGHQLAGSRPRGRAPLGAARRASGTLYAVACVGSWPAPRSSCVPSAPSARPAAGSRARRSGALSSRSCASPWAARTGSLAPLTAVGGAVLLFAVASAGVAADDGGLPLEDAEALR